MGDVRVQAGRPNSWLSVTVLWKAFVREVLAERKFLGQDASRERGERAGASRNASILLGRTSSWLYYITMTWNLTIKL